MTTLKNHVTAKLSSLDLMVISHIPPGGNWRDVPETIPSARLEQIRKSYKQGKGSRSTYYGRLLEHDAAYTVSTYFTRPGNGCNIHYRQDRTLSYREAARLQSFPDSFEFFGSKTAVANQIGNAVPPLLAFQIAQAIDLKKVAFLDLFSGAGGMALGLTWAGWYPIVSNDIDTFALQTHSANLSSPTILGDVTSVEVKQALLTEVRNYREQNSDHALFVVGGPPCQGFSTANGGRSASDTRNWLFKEYIELVRALEPDGFLFENVQGILSLEHGTFFKRIVSELHELTEEIRLLRLNAAEFGVPQRRNRVFILGGSESLVSTFNLSTLTDSPRVLRRDSRGLSEPSGRDAITVGEALGDLPPLAHATDGSSLSYATEALTSYQKLMRGDITPYDFLRKPR